MTVRVVILMECGECHALLISGPHTLQDVDGYRLNLSPEQCYVHAPAAVWYKVVSLVAVSQ